jgi:2-polyprenyl-3-methyl-5-hydroxy-6-metoxy-1,4-benzoquinol methylase
MCLPACWSVGMSARDGQDDVTFSFGENWKAFLETVDAAALASATDDITAWLGEGGVRGARILDVGCGSGLHSLAFHLMGAREVVSFDFDRHSVEATRDLWTQAGAPESWTVRSGSVLDARFIASIGRVDVVYAWGVLHHTGSMWEAIKNAAIPVRDDGRFWIALYRKGPRYERDLRRKRRYNAASPLVKKAMIGEYVARTMGYRLAHGKNPLRWNQRTARGMNVYYDIVDWLGGLPYEVAAADEVVSACGRLGFHLERLQEANEGGCSVFLFRRTGVPRAPALENGE